MSVLLSPGDARTLIWSALTGSGTSPDNAAYFTEAILDTELSGLEGHGFYWLQYYCAHLRSGKVDGKAVPQVEALSDTSFRVDAQHGFAHPAIEAGFRHLIPAARAHGSRRWVSTIHTTPRRWGFTPGIWRVLAC